MDGITTYNDLVETLQDWLPELSPGKRRIAELLLTEPSDSAFRSVNRTAELADVHPSTVVRFARSLGLDGYPSLVRLCRESLVGEAQLLHRLHDAQRQTSEEDLLTASVTHEQDNLARTLNRIDRKQWDATVNLLASAPSVHIMGLRKCLPVAQLMAYLLRLVRPNVHHIAPISGGLVDDLNTLAPEDVFVAISIHRYTADTITAFKHAVEQGLHTVALTDNAASPLAAADHTYYVDCEGTTILRSVTSFVSLVQTLATAVTLANDTRSRDELLGDEQLFSKFDLYSR